MSTLRLELPTIADASSDDMSATIDRERRATDYQGSESSRAGYPRRRAPMNIRRATQYFPPEQSH
jgi:hypothetical protein